MPTNKSSIVLTQLDFDSQKESLKQYLKEQDAFRDYDFDGSNMSTLLDILSYNTYLNTFYLNMIANEMWLDTAQLRDSVVSHAKELNYLPRSFSSSVAKISLTVTAQDSTKKSILIPKGTAFLSRVGDNTFSFLTDQNIIINSSNGVFTSEITLYEGSYLSDTYAIDYNQPLKFKITNNTVDLSSISVTVIEDNGSKQIKYSRATTLLGLDETKEVYFIQPSSNGTYEISFGDDIISKRPKNNSIILIEYRVCSGELPNGAQKFIASGKIDDETNISISTITPASFGAVAETVESIKYNASRAFTTQERAITAEDYENILKINFPEINAVSAFGGEDANPPQYGRVFITVDLKDVDDLPINKKNEYIRFLKSKSSVAMEPVFMSPEYIYLNVNSKVKYNINKTGLNIEDIRTLVASSILSYSSSNLNNFNRTMRYSRLVKNIDDSDDSIVSNDTSVKLIKYIRPELNVTKSYTIDFKTKLLNNSSIAPDEHNSSDFHTITSSPFTYFGQRNCIIEDNGNGILRVISQEIGLHKTIIEIGTVDYEKGIIKINNLSISDLIGSNLKIYASTYDKDIISNQNVILNILEEDVVLDITQVRE